MVEVWSWVNGTNVRRGILSPDRVCNDFFHESLQVLGCLVNLSFEVFQRASEVVGL